MGNVKSRAIRLAVYLAYWLNLTVIIAVTFAYASDVAWDFAPRFVGQGLRVATPHYDTEYGLYLFILHFGTPAMLTCLAMRRLKRLTITKGDI